MLGDAVRVRSVAEFSTVEPEETGLSFIENAILKARNAARISGLPAWPMTRAWRSTPWRRTGHLLGALRRWSRRRSQQRQAAAGAARRAGRRARRAVRLRWPWCGTPTIHCRSSVKASGMGASCMRRARARLRLRPAVLGTGVRLLQRRAARRAEEPAQPPRTRHGPAQAAAGDMIAASPAPATGQGR